ncbi:electron transport complex subunit RsxC [Chitinibacteraceae bacterium HSL-7]
MIKLHRFHGGVHPPEHKAESNGTPIAAIPLAEEYVVPLVQGVGSDAEPCVSVGDTVLKGQRIAEPAGALGVAVHAPTSGVVSAIEARVLAHASGLSGTCVLIKADGRDEWGARVPVPWRDWLDAGQAFAVRDALRDAGVVGLGGAMFPSHRKLGGQGLGTLIINGAECEPFITCDDRLMREHASEVVEGVRIAAALMQAKRVLIGIEDNKPEAIAAMRQACAGSGFDVVAIPTIYPSGSARQLIRILTGTKVPAGVRTTDYDVQCFNVATVHTMYRALVHGEPVISRIVTLTGQVARPGNYNVPIGTPVHHLVDVAGGEAGRSLVYGGPMMGFELPDAGAGLSKGGNCIIVGELSPAQPPEMPCIRCGRCADACPAELQPMDLYWFARARQFGRAQERELFSCIECGACAYVCPSSIPLVDYYRNAKSEIWAAERLRVSAERAKKRHEARQARFARIEAEKAAKLAARKAATPAPASAPVADASAAPPAAAPTADEQRAQRIKAAMAKAKERAAAPAPVDPIAERQAAAEAALAELPDDERAAREAEKKAKIAAAMARAQALRASQDKPADPQARSPGSEQNGTET